ncbi:MAG: SpoIIE family protein phosphatase [Candidatus Riflebacteria bacterium]|nr:SpoIIE family protein phosphatase [Candidatus Riflebacteria bacterium]
MRENRAWLAIVLLLWGIPSVLFWMGVEACRQVLQDRETERRRGHLAETLSRFAAAADFRTFFQARLNRLYEGLAGLEPGSPAFQAELRRREAEFPAGAVQTFFFGEDGTCRHPTGFPAQPDLERFFRAVHQPWTSGWARQPRAYPLLGDLVPEPTASDHHLSLAPQGTLCFFGDFPGAPRSRPDHGLYRWRPGTSGRSGGGFLALVNRSVVAASFLLDRVRHDLADPGVALGFAFSSPREATSRPAATALAGIPPLMASGSFAELLERFRREPSTEFAHDGLLVASRIFDQDILLIAVTALPGWSARVWLLLAGLYGFLSFRFLVFLFRATDPEFRAPVSLRQKWYLVFGLGVIFPLALSFLLGNLYLDRKRQELTGRHREEAFQFLDTVDRGFEEFLAGQERSLRQACREPDRARLDDLLDRWYADGQLNDYYLISSTSRVLRWKNSPGPSAFRELAQRSMAERRDMLRVWFANGGRLNPDEVFRFSGPDPVTLSAADLSDDQRNLVQQGLVLIAEEIISQVDIRHGLPPTRPRKPGVTVDSLLTGEYQGLLQAARHFLGILKFTDNAGNMDYHFIEVIRGPDGRGWYFLFTSTPSADFETRYLEALFASPAAVRPRFGELKALTFPNPLGRGFPDLREAEFYFPVLERALAGHPTVISTREERDGGAVQVIGKRGQFLRQHFLILETPVTWFDREMAAHRREVVLYLVGSALLCLLLSRLLTEKLMRPLDDVAEGLRAIRRQDFAFRVPVPARDELGHLCQAVNDSIVHLQEMEITSVIQANLYPRHHVQAGPFGVSGKNLMLQAVGGDFYDYLPLPDGRWGIVLGDVSGHGISAALVTAMAKAAFTILVPQYPDRPDRVLADLSDQFSRLLKRKMMMTCFLGVLDPAREKILATCAGQCSPLLVRPDRSADFLSLPSLPLGMSRKARYVTQEIDLAAAALVLYSDGLVEKTNDQDEPIGYERFAALVPEVMPLPTEVRLDRLIRQVEAFAPSVPWADDVTVVIVAKDSLFLPPGRS